MSDMVIISICAGNRDVLINPELADLSPIAPLTHSFTVFTTGMPSVWTSMDHQAIVWCKQVARKLVSALVAAVDASRPEKTLIREKRLVALESVLQSPLLRTRASKKIPSSVIERSFDHLKALNQSQLSLLVTASKNLLIKLDHSGNKTLVFFTDMKMDSELNLFLVQR
jgi:glycosylphosphatidylinositol deacylase